MKWKVFSYSQLDTPVHRLSGFTKFVCFLLLSFAVMFSYDIRVIFGMTVLSFAVFRAAKIRFSQIKLMLLYVLVFVVTNALITYLFSPEEGVAIYGTRHLLFQIAGRYSITQEQLLYQATKFLKYVSVIPLGIIFFLTTDPSELASSLSGVGISYKATYAVALTLRYFPDIVRDYTDISLAQQARGLDLSKKAKLSGRFKNAVAIVLPLIFSTLDRIELISNAMDLRGFGKHRTRTWYSRRPLRRADWLALAGCTALFLGTVAVSVFVNGSRFYNPFVS